MTRRPRALHIAPIMPARSGNGLAMRQGMFLEALSRNFDTRLVVLPVAGGANDGELPDQLGVETTVIPVAGRQDTHFRLLSQLADSKARTAAFRAYGRTSLAACLSVPVLADLRAALGEEGFDLVHIGRSYLADALSAVPSRATLDLDEDEWTSYREVAATQRIGDAVAADRAEAEADAMSALIGRSAGQFARHFISSEWDAESIGRQHSGLVPEVVENAVTVPPEAGRSDDGRTVLFIGSFGYAPNLDAITWFVREIWPMVLAQSPQWPRLRIVGRDAGRVAALAGSPGVEIVGEVESVAPSYAAATLLVAPMRAGAGTRLKLLEAMAHRVPVVTTSLGARGIPIISGREALVADDAAGFADAMLQTLTDREAANSRADDALALIRARYDRSRTVERLACRLHDIVAT